MYKIGEMSKLCNIPVKTLRYYDSEGLLIPDKIDKFTGYRYYSASKLDDCYRIIALKELNFSLTEIKAQLAAQSDEKIIAALNAKLSELNNLIKSTEKQLSKIKSIMNNLTEGDVRMFNIVVRTANDIRVSFIRKNYKNKSEAINDINQISNSLPKAIVGKQRIIINYEIECKDTNQDLAACVEILSNPPKNALYSEKTISFGCKSASLVCNKCEIEDAYKTMVKYIDSSEYTVSGAYYEIYHDDNTVELRVPVRERANVSDDIFDHVNTPFIDDPDVCGKWEMIDIVPTREHFVYGNPKSSSLSWLKELYFIDGGKPYWVLRGWTKDYLITRSPAMKPIANKYSIENKGEHKLLFVEMNNYYENDSVGFTSPEIWVYEKAEDKHYSSKEDIRRCDNIDYPFINDDTVLGVWKVRDFVTSKENFNPQNQNWAKDDLFVLQVEFKNDGEYIATTKNFTNAISSVWTKGLILNRSDKTASAYEINVIDGNEYLFTEWKSGDYSFGGGKVYWYVFTRVEANSKG